MLDHHVPSKFSKFAGILELFQELIVLNNGEDIVNIVTCPVLGLLEQDLAEFFLPVLH
eukprot:CAMPEP_0197018758 /NCGR_PEP_ID=MMETSP1380-20130617/80289_1 /TAXON_ID=5936 /ORGANISM="Euplotes crassus, Strain CT5" /LENGTH=57 /DNA_ID=CAMNT_0042446033 /DNA_START=848 /DNA_END=1021 /DNA_ORIENTATION=+